MPRWPNKTLYTGFKEVAEEDPDSTALVFEGTTITYGALHENVRSLAAGLSAHGIDDQDTIAVWLANRPEWITLQLAASSLGAPVVAVNTRYRMHELEYMLEDAGCSVLVTEESFLDVDYFDILDETISTLDTHTPDEFESESFPKLEHVISIDEAETYSAIRSYEDVAGSGDEGDRPRPADDPEATGTIFYTSGTTSDPKGCLQTNRSLLNHSYQVGEHLGVTSEDTALSLVPFCGVLGYNYLFSALTHGMPIVVQTHFDPSNTARLLREHDVTYLNAIPTIYDRTIDAEEFDQSSVDSVRRAVVTFMNGYEEETFERLEDTLGAPLVQPYGLSEANSQVFVGDPSDPKSQRKKVGGPLISPEEVEAKIVDPDTGETLPTGEAGELCLRGYIVMDGYLNKPDRTAEAIDDDGWLHTGDIAHRDEKGYLYYRSRLGDAIRVRGFLVTPAEIEEVIQEVDGVDKAQVVAAPHDHYGQVPVAFVIRDDAGDATGSDIRAHTADRMADYKVPEAVSFVDSFPRTEGPHGEKVQKPKLRERAAELIED
jgi:fatty-acyl-CoA synthase